ncbi:MAG: Crp/Fnr family transcriptional regulator [Mesorhizobium sp.]
MSTFDAVRLRENGRAGTSRILLMDPPPAGADAGPSTDTHRFDPQPLIASLERRDALSDTERQALRDLPWRVKRFGDSAEIVAEAERPTESCLLVEGLAARSRHLANGNRQLTALHVPGDFIDLHGFFLKVMDHAVIALEPVTVAFVPHRDIERIATAMPHLGRMLFLTVAIDAAIQRNWIACMGRMEPIRHLAYMVCEVYKRLEVVGRVENGTFDFPLTQAELADLVGLSIVHVNRTLQDLRATGLATWKGNRIVIRDWDGLARLADFDPTYLNLFHHPR